MTAPTTGPAASLPGSGQSAARSAAPFQSVELTRYARHIVLREIGGAGQQKLKNAKVLIVGAGGLGSPSLLYLAGAGIGRIGVADDDIVSVSNLQRQIIHAGAEPGESKVASACRMLAALNPYVETVPHGIRITSENSKKIAAEYDIVLDGSDSFETRQVINAACVELGKPLVYGAISQWEGQVSVFHPCGGAPCYACIFPEEPAPGLVPSCAEAGVVGPLPGVIGSIMALETVKLIAGAGRAISGSMLVFDGLWGETRTISLSRRADCFVCGECACRQD